MSHEPFRKGHYLMLGDEPPSPIRQNALSHLLRNRSHASLSNYGSIHHRPAGPDDEESALAHVHPHPEPSYDDEPRRSSTDGRRMEEMLRSVPMRSMRLIGNSSPRYQWQRYWKTDDQLRQMKKPLRKYYERTNYLVQQYMYIDRLLDSSLPHDLLNEYNDTPAGPYPRAALEVPATISEEGSSTHGDGDNPDASSGSSPTAVGHNSSPESEQETSNHHPYAVSATKKIKRTPKNIYRPSETTPLFAHENGQQDSLDTSLPEVPGLDEDDEEVDSGDRIVSVAIYVNFAANLILLAGKIAVVMSVPSMSVLASLVDAVLDFLSTIIVWLTTWLISRQDIHKYPVGRRRLEPLGVLVFAVIMITSFVQVALESLSRLASPNHELVQVGFAALAIMVGTVVIKGLCWLWCRLVKNSSVQALAADAMTDVIFNTGSILFPIVGYYAGLWWMDALGGLLLSLVVIFNWSETSLEHIKHLSGFSATPDQRGILLYLTMRFAKTIKSIQGLQAYHAGDKLIAEVDIILDQSTTLRDSHDLSESLGYVLESVPIVDRAFVHADYATYNLPTHMEQQQS